MMKSDDKAKVGDQMKDKKMEKKAKKTKKAKKEKKEEGMAPAAPEKRKLNHHFELKRFIVLTTKPLFLFLPNGIYSGDQAITSIYFSTEVALRSTSRFRHTIRTPDLPSNRLFPHVSWKYPR